MAVTTLILAGPGDTLDFEVAMDTHSVDLSLDLASLSTLQTDSGRMLPAALWSGGGGQYAAGILRFLTVAADCYSALEGAVRITRTIESLDAPPWAFQRDLP